MSSPSVDKDHRLLKCDGDASEFPARTCQPDTSNIDVIVEAMSPLLLAKVGSSPVWTNEAEL